MVGADVLKMKYSPCEEAEYGYQKRGYENENCFVFHYVFYSLGRLSLVCSEMASGFFSI